MDHTTQTFNRAEAERSLSIAAKLLAARDLVGSKRFAELALDADPRLPDERADQILAVADVLLASQKRFNNHYDWYSILQIPHPTPPNSDHILKCNYRRLSLLLHPDRNRSPGADAAFKLIIDAYNVLSDPSKRSLFDAEVKISEKLSSPASGSGGSYAANDASSFWTLCPSCCHVHQFARVYQNKMLKCQTCGRVFQAVELQAQPTIVPGTDMYYATWGFFPLGFANPETNDWKPFQSVCPGGGSGPFRGQPPADGPGNGDGGIGGVRGPAVPAGRNKKKTARKKVVSSGIKHRIFGDFEDPVDLIEDDDDDHIGGEARQREEDAARGININEAAKGGGEEDIEMIIDLDATDDMLGNLQNLPFLKDSINIRIP